MGVAAMDCDCLARDMAKIFDVYWAMGGSTSTAPPSEWPQHLTTSSNLHSPMKLQADSKPTDAYLAVSVLVVNSARWITYNVVLYLVHNLA